MFFGCVCVCVNALYDPVVKVVFGCVFLCFVRALCDPDVLVFFVVGFCLKCIV